MGKIVFWLLVGLAAYGAWRLFTVSQRRQERSRATDASKQSGADQPLAEPMVACEHCGLRVPRSEAFRSHRSAALHYCSDAHRQDAEGGS
jgi:uncharacterized protein